MLAAMLLVLSAFAPAEGGILLFNEDAGVAQGRNSDETLLLEWGDDGAPAAKDAPDSVSLTELIPGALEVSEAPQAESAATTDAQDEASEEEGAIDLKAEYKGKTQTKVYDGTADLTRDGRSLLSPGFKKDDFKLTGISKDYPDVYLNTIRVLKSFTGADAGKYKLKFSFTLAGDDASHYKAPVVKVPAKITRKPIDASDVMMGTISDQIYTGKRIKPAVPLRYGKYNLKMKKDYAAVYRNNLMPGTATVTIKGKGNFTGKRTATFDIVPKGTKLKNLSAQRNTIEVTWNKQTKGVMGYLIEYDIYRNFADADEVRVKGPNSTQTTLTGLIANSKYYVRIRTYYKKNGETYCSAWSEAMTVKTR